MGQQIFASWQDGGHRTAGTICSCYKAHISCWRHSTEMRLTDLSCLSTWLPEAPKGLGHGFINGTYRSSIYMSVVSGSQQSEGVRDVVQELPGYRHSPFRDRVACAFRQPRETLNGIAPTVRELR